MRQYPQLEFDLALLRSNADAVISRCRGMGIRATPTVTTTTTTSQTTTTTAKTTTTTATSKTTATTASTSSTTGTTTTEKIIPLYGDVTVTAVWISQTQFY